MKNKYLKLVNVVLLFLFCSLSFGQVKQITPQTIKNTFQTKKVKPSRAVITPKRKGEDSTNLKEDYFTQNKDSSVTIKFTEKSKTKASDFFVKFSKKLKIGNDDSFIKIKAEKDAIGLTHYRYQQNYKGIPLDGVQFLLHEKNSNLTSANGDFHSGLSLNTTASISKQDAIQKAIEFVGAEKYLWNNKDEEDFLKKEKNDTNATYYPKAELVIAPINGDYSKDNFRLCYKINIFSEVPYDNVDVYIDAQTGKAINKIGKIAHADVVGTANTLYNGTKTITMDNTAGTYTLKESTRPIQTFNMQNGVNYANAVDFTNTSNNWNSKEVVLESITISAVNNNWEDGLEQFLLVGKPDIFIEIRDVNNTLIWSKVNNINGQNVSAYYENTFPSITFNTGKLVLLNGPYTLKIFDDDVNSPDDLLGTFSFTAVSGTGTFSANGTSGSISRILRNNPGLDAHWGAEVVYDYFLTQHSRNSFDNTGGVIKNYVHRGIAWNNASWNGLAMSYGDGDGISEGPQSALDVCGHELTHAVIQYTANLYYQNESGALNESFSDIFGTAIEYYGTPSTADFLFSEKTFLQNGDFSRSLQEPKLKNQPNTYNGNNWAPLITSSYPTQPPTRSSDWGGVHINSGVQNYWFYLLSQGGSGTIDDAGTKPYSVTGIGIAKATKIAYQNLVYHLKPTSNYMDAYNNSLLAAEELYPSVGGIHSQEYNSVRQAWYAVGIGSDPSNSCAGTTNLTASSGTFSDGSGTVNYGDNSSCKWVIAPAGATQVSIDFTTFDTEATFDKVYVYDGPDDTAPLLATWWGNTLPPTITTSTGIGAMCVKFTSDATTTLGGWTAKYNATIVTPTCSGVTLLTTPTGTFTGGSGSGNYTNNQQCYWYIAPACATSVTLSFSQLNTELNYDGIAVYDSSEATNLIGFYSGTTLPASITSTTGTMLVLFISDYTNVLQGFTANYTSTGSSYCSGVTTLNTSDYGTITDGSGANNYCNNSNCSWLIQPPQATTVTFNFTEFELESASSDGNSIFDAVEIFDGTSASAPLLGRFTGSTIPSSITSSGGSMFIRFYSDVASNFQGWSGYYTSTQNGYCDASTNTLITPTGTFSDGSGANKYSNNADCSWLIQPIGASSVTLSFSAFDTELNYDGVIVYDGANNSAPVLGKFTGTSIPSPVTSTGGSIYVSFLSDESERSSGWSANFTSTNLPSPTTFNLDRKLMDSAGDTQTSGSTIITWSLGEPIIGNMNNGNVKLTNGFHPLLNSQTLEIQDSSINLSIIISPNPTNDFLNIYQQQNHDLKVSVFDISGKYIIEETFNFQDHKIDVRRLTKGVYIFYVQDQQTQKTNTYKIIKN